MTRAVEPAYAPSTPRDFGDFSMSLQPGRAGANDPYYPPGPDGTYYPPGGESVYPGPAAYGPAYPAYVPYSTGYAEYPQYGAGMVQGAPPYAAPGYPVQDYHYEQGYQAMPFDGAGFPGDPNAARDAFLGDYPPGMRYAPDHPSQDPAGGGAWPPPGDGAAAAAYREAPQPGEWTPPPAPSQPAATDDGTFVFRPPELSPAQ